jgi:hypothetical protein
MRTPTAPPVGDVLHKITGNPTPVLAGRRTDAAANHVPGTDNRPTRVAPPRLADAADPSSSARGPDEKPAEPSALITEFIGYGVYIAKIAGTARGVSCGSDDNPEGDDGDHDGDHVDPDGEASRCSAGGTDLMS